MDEEGFTPLCVIVPNRLLLRWYGCSECFVSLPDEESWPGHLCATCAESLEKPFEAN